MDAETPSYYEQFPHLCHATVALLSLMCMAGLALAGVAANVPWFALGVLQLVNLALWCRVPR